MPNAVVDPDIRARRLRDMQPIREYLEHYGIPQAVFARRVGISKMRLWYYLRGDNEAPEWFVPRALQVMMAPHAKLPPPPPAKHSGRRPHSHQPHQMTEPPRSRRSRARRAEHPPGDGERCIPVEGVAE